MLRLRRLRPLQPHVPLEASKSVLHSRSLKQKSAGDAGAHVVRNVREIVHASCSMVCYSWHVKLANSHKDPESGRVLVIVVVCESYIFFAGPGQSCWWLLSTLTLVTRACQEQQEFSGFFVGPGLSCLRSWTVWASRIFPTCPTCQECSCRPGSLVYSPPRSTRPPTPMTIDTAML